MYHPSQSPKHTPPKVEAKRPEEDDSGKSPQTTPSNVAVVSPMPSLKKQRLQKAAAAATAASPVEAEKLNNSSNKVSASVQLRKLGGNSIEKFGMKNHFKNPLGVILKKMFLGEPRCGS